jgi:hypothetical protein
MNTYEDDTIAIFDDELPETFHVVTKKIGELGIIFKPNKLSKYCFKQTDLNKYLKPYHIITILHELNIKNGVDNNIKHI